VWPCACVPVKLEDKGLGGRAAAAGATAAHGHVAAQEWAQGGGAARHKQVRRERLGLGAHRQWRLHDTHKGGAPGCVQLGQRETERGRERESVCV
jgi:hypothetical protein